MKRSEIPFYIISWVNGGIITGIGMSSGSNGAIFFGLVLIGIATTCYYIVTTDERPFSPAELETQYQLVVTTLNRKDDKALGALFAPMNQTQRNQIVAYAAGKVQL